MLNKNSTSENRCWGLVLKRIPLQKIDGGGLVLNKNSTSKNRWLGLVLNNNSTSENRWWGSSIK